MFIKLSHVPNLLALGLFVMIALMTRSYLVEMMSKNAPSVKGATMTNEQKKNPKKSASELITEASKSGRGNLLPTKSIMTPTPTPTITQRNTPTASATDSDDQPETTPGQSTPAPSVQTVTPTPVSSEKAVSPETVETNSTQNNSELLSFIEDEIVVDPPVIPQIVLHLPSLINP